MTWKVIDCFQRDFIPLCISGVSGFTIKRHASFMKAHIVNWGGRREFTQIPHCSSAASFGRSFLEIIMRTEETGHSKQMQSWASCSSSSPVPLPFPKVSCAPCSSMLHLTAPTWLQPWSLSRYSSRAGAGLRSYARSKSRDIWGSALPEVWHDKLVLVNNMQVVGKRGDVGKGVTPSPSVVVSPW